MYDAEWSAVWQHVLTRHSRKEKIVTIGLTKTRSLALMACVWVIGWGGREADCVQQSQWQNGRKRWKERWQKKNIRTEATRISKTKFHVITVARKAEILNFKILFATFLSQNKWQFSFVFLRCRHLCFKSASKSCRLLFQLDQHA